MQRLIKIVFLSIALIYLGGMIYQVGYFTYFKLNQDNIVAEYCANKAKPEMHCNGQCHLNKQLEKSQLFDKDDQNEQERMPSVTLEVIIAVFPEDRNDSINGSNELYVLAWSHDEKLCNSEKDAFWHPPKV